MFDKYSFKPFYQTPLFFNATFTLYASQYGIAWRLPYDFEILVGLN